jgi:exonuclease III
VVARLLLQMLQVLTEPKSYKLTVIHTHSVLPSIIVMIAQSPPHSSPLLRLGTWNAGLGFMKKLPTLLHRCSDLDLDIIAVQEIGDPALLITRLPHYQLIYSAGPSRHEAGVGLLLSHRLLPRCRSYKQSTTGRLAAAVLEYEHGKKTLVVSAYMPAGLDHCSPASEKSTQAHALYTEITEWSRDMHQVIVMGDLNETLTQWDRQPPTIIAAHSSTILSPIHSLPASGFIDAYRHLHPSPAITPGFTHYIDSALRPSSSRLDYVWLKGFPTVGVHSAVIDKHQSLHRLSHHRLLLVTVTTHHTLGHHAPTHKDPLRLPNLRSASDADKLRFVQHVEIKLQRTDHKLRRYSSAAAGGLHVRENIDLLAATLTSITSQQAQTHLPLNASNTYHNKDISDLQRQRSALSRLSNAVRVLLSSGHTPAQLLTSPEIMQLRSACHQRFGIVWSSNISLDVGAWLQETETFIRLTRSSVRAQYACLRKQHDNHFTRAPAAVIHRMLQSDALPAAIHSVVTPDGHLTQTAIQLQECMASHFEHVFSVPPRPAAGFGGPSPPAMLFSKPGINTSWYAQLMIPVLDAELQQAAAGLPLISAPGEDGVSSGVWKIAIAGSVTLRNHLCALFSLCLAKSIFPTGWKTGIIIPLLKDINKERTMSNIRPITLQSCLGKLLSRLLAERLASILERHPILNTSQRGFINGGSTHKCIDELLDAWRWSREHQQPLYTLFYDIKQAYDSVETDVLLRALRRLHMPATFVALVADSLTGLQSRVRTEYGNTRAFDVHRSLRQGDPLAPLLFVILVDALHDGLHTDPFTHEQHGCTVTVNSQSVYLPSLGFADDTNTISNSLAGLAAMHRWTLYFMQFNRMRLNATKCEVVGTHDGQTSVTTADLVHHGLTVEGNCVATLPLDSSTRYLGVHCSYSGSWWVQQRKSLAHIMLFTRIATKFNMPIAHIVYMFNVFLLPKLESALRFCSGPRTTQWLQACDRLLIGCIKHLSRSPVRVSHTTLALSLGLRLPSWLEVSIKASELFIRANTSDQRWGHLGRLQLRSHVAGSPAVDVAGPGRRSGNHWMASAVSLIACRLQWTMQQRHTSSHRRAAVLRTAGSNTLLEHPPIDGMPTHSECSSSQLISALPASFTIAHDVWCGFGAGCTAHSVAVYTDGSAQYESSSWAVVISDRWLARYADSLPTDEALLQPAHVAGATLAGAAITVTTGVYPAELQAIARVLAMLPLSFHVHVHSDSQASIAAVQAFRLEASQRARLRMPARPLLFLINHLCSIRERAGGSVTLAHVKAHTTNSDIHSVGNRLADYQANRARVLSQHTQPRGLQPLPLDKCEPFLCLKNNHGSVIIDDIRRTSMRELKQQAMERWRNKPWPANSMACDGMVALSKVVLSTAPSELQSFLVHLSTNSLHFRWDAPDAAASSSSSDTHHVAEPSRVLHKLQCRKCVTAVDMCHVVNCPEPYVKALHQQLHTQIVNSLLAEPLSRPWAVSHQHLPLIDLLDRMFPQLSAPLVDTLHHATLLCGAWSRNAQSHAIRVVGLAKSDNALAVFNSLRLVCIRNVRHFFVRLHVSIV